MRTGPLVRTGWIGLGLLLCACACALSAGAIRGRPGDEPSTTTRPVQSVRILATYPHDSRAFTQGLAIQAGQLYEGTGNYGESVIRRVELTTGRVLQETRLDPEDFGEGITLWGDRIVQLTWRQQRGLIYDTASLRRTAAFALDGEGWGLTHDGRYWIASDGSEVLRFIDPLTHTVVKRLRVLDEARPVRSLNELEYVKGEVWANIWYSDKIARIDPASGQVLGYLDLSGLIPEEARRDRERVLNGIAYDAASDRLFVTGKYWPSLYEIQVPPAASRAVSK